MTNNDRVEYAMGFGALPLIAAARFTPADGADPAIVHSFGIETITRAAEGQWDVTLSNNNLEALGTGFPIAIVHVSVMGHVDTTADEGHFLGIISITESTGVVRVCHKADTADAWTFQDIQGLSGVTVLIYGQRG